MQRTTRFVGPLGRQWPLAVSKLSRVLRDPASCLSLASASRRDVWAPDGTADQPTIRAIARVADGEIGTPWPQPTASGYARYFRDGDRQAYERRVFHRQERLTRAVVMAASTLEPAWLDEAIDGISMLCEQSSWCWPAHDDNSRHHRAIVPIVTSPVLDLGAGEVVAQLAWADHLLADQLDERVPGLRARIRHEADVRVLGPFAERRDWHWLGLDGYPHNWSPWIQGNVLVAALRLVDEPGRRANLVALAIEGIDRFVAALPADGAVDEGFGYWWNGACRALEALDVLADATGGALVVTDVEQLRATVAFPHQMHIGSSWYLNLADSSARAPDSLPWHCLHRAALCFGDDTARRHAGAHRRPGEPVASVAGGLGRLLRALTDESWKTAGPTPPPLVRDSWLPSIQVMVTRTTAGSPRGLCLAVKGGHNGEHHNHNDIGSLVVAVNGTPVVVDAGRTTYTAKTFGPARYEIATMQSSWHCVPEIRGTAQAPGRQFAARDVEAGQDDDGGWLRMDLAAAYPRNDVRRWWRTARLERKTGAVVIITDAWMIDPHDGVESAAPSVVHYLLAGEVRLTGEGGAIVRAIDDAGDILVDWEPATAQAQLTELQLDDPALREVWGARLVRLGIELGDAHTGTLTVRIREA